jgi:hypothetical protein
VSQLPPQQPADQPAEQPAPLPRRDPQPIVLHVLVDTAVAFLLLVIVLLFLGASIWVVLIASIVAGLAAAPITRRAEERALAQRPEA